MTPRAANGWAIRLDWLPQCLRKGSSSNAVLPPSTGIYSRSGVLPVARPSCPEPAHFRFRTKAMIPIPAKASPPINGGSPQESSCTAILRFSAGPASASAANPRISNETSTPITPTTSRIQLRTCTAFPPLGTLMVCSGWIQQREPARQPYPRSLTCPGGQTRRPGCWSSTGGTPRHRQAETAATAAGRPGGALRNPDQVASGKR